MTETTATVPTAPIQTTAATLTILSTIAIRSQQTKLILALLKSENFLQLQIVELEPNVSDLAVNVDDAILARDAHLLVLDQLKNQQSPVEELLRKAEDVQKTDASDKTEIYTKMTENLTDAWNDIENLLGKRKEILETNVKYRKLIRDYFQSVDNVRKQSMDDNRLIDFEFAKKHSENLAASRKGIMQKLFLVLRFGNELVIHLNDLKSVGKVIDCRPEQDMFHQIKKTLDEVEKSFESVSRKRKQFEDFYKLEKAKLDRFLDVLLNEKSLAEFENDLNEIEEKIAINKKYFTLESKDQFLIKNERQLQLLIKLREKTLRFTYSLEKGGGGGGMKSNNRNDIRNRNWHDENEMIGISDKNEQIFDLRKQIGNLQLSMMTTTMATATETETTANNDNQNISILKSYQTLDTLNNLITLLQKFKTKLTMIDDFFATKREMIWTKLIDFENELKTCENYEESEKKLTNLKNELIIEHLESGKTLIGSLEKLNLPEMSEKIENHLEKTARKVYEFDCYFESRKTKLAKKRADEKIDDEILRKFNETHNEIANELALIENNIRMKNSQLGTDLLSTKTIRNESSENLRQLQAIGMEINRFLNSLLPARRLFTEPGTTSERQQRLHAVNETIDRLHSRWVSFKHETERKLDLTSTLIDFYAKSNEWLSAISEIVSKIRFAIDDSNNNKSNIVDDDNISSMIDEQRKNEHNELISFANDLIANIENYAKNFAIETIDSLDSLKSILDQLREKSCEFDLCSKNFYEFRDLSNQWDKIMEESLMIVNVATKLRNQLYPIIDFEFNTLSDLINELKRKSTRMLPELDKILHEIDTKIHDTEQLSLKSEQIAQQSQTITQKLRDLRTNLGTIIDEYNQLIRETIDFFVHLQEFDRQLEFENVENSPQSLNDFQASSSLELAGAGTAAAGANLPISVKLTANLSELEKFQDSLIRKIQQNETNETAAERDTNVLIAIFQEQKLHLKEILAKRQKEFDAKQDAILFESNLQGIYKALDQLTDQLNDIRADLGDSRESVHKNCRLFQTFEKTTEILNEKIYQLCDQDVSIDDNVRNAKLIELNERLQRFESDVKIIKDLLHKSLYYYDLIEKAENWIDSGTELLNEIADKSNLICSVEEAKILRNEIEKYLQVDERQQNERINEISKLSFELFKTTTTTTKTASGSGDGATETDEKNSAQQLIDKNKHIFTSFARIDNELNSLAIQFESYRSGDENERRKFTMRLPEFERPLTNVLIEAGDTLRLQCVVRGEPEPFIKWLFNGEQLNESSENVRMSNECGRLELVRERVDKEHEGYYTIHARNRMGDVNSSCNVYVRQLASSGVSGGDGGNDEIDVNGQCEQETAAATVTVTAAAAAAVVERRTEKNPIRPKIQSPLKDQQVRLGEQAILECVIVCEPEPEVIWYHDSSLVKESANIKLQFQGDQCSLIIKSTVFEDSGCYRVVAINAAGEASSQCFLNIANHDFQQTRTVKNVTESLPIEPVPILKRKLENCRIDEGETLLLACDALHVDNYKWFHNHHQLRASANNCDDDDDDNKYRFVHDRESNRISLEIRECSLRDAGEYSVYLANRVGQIHCTAHVEVTRIAEIGSEMMTASPKTMMTTVTETATVVTSVPATAKVQPPKIINGLVGRICEQGTDSTLFECIYHVYPANSVEIEWHRNNSQIVENENYSIVNLPNKSILKFTNISHQMSGKYSCTIRNSAGSISSTADLVVKKTTFPPVFGRRLKDQDVMTGDRIQMEIEVTGTPKPDIAWFKDNVPIAECLAPNDFQLKCHGNHNELVIFSAKFYHSGEYLVKATNSVGETFSNAKIAIFEMAKVQQEQPEPYQQQHQLHHQQQERLQQQTAECSSFVQKLFYESKEIEKTRLQPKTIDSIIVVDSENVDSNTEHFPSLLPPSISKSKTAAVAATVAAETATSSKTFEESRLYFIEKLSQNQQQQQQHENSKKKSLKYSSSLKLDGESSRRRFETTAKSVSPRPEALEMEKLWATSSNNLLSASSSQSTASKNRVADDAYSFGRKSQKDYYNVVYESRNPFLCNNNDMRVQKEHGNGNETEVVVAGAAAAASIIATVSEEQERDEKKPESHCIRSQSESGYIADTEEQQKESRRNFRTYFDNRFRQNEIANISTTSSSNSRRNHQILSFDEEERQKESGNGGNGGNQTKLMSLVNRANHNNDSRRTTITNSSPSKFVARNHHVVESDYENESIVRERIAVVWSPAVNDDTLLAAQSRPQPSYKPVRADFVKNHTKVTLPPTCPPSAPPSRPKFEPIDKPKLLSHAKPDNSANENNSHRSQILYKPKPVSVKNQILYRNENEIVLKPGSPPQLLFSDSRPGSCCNETIAPSTPLPNPVFYRATTAGAVAAAVTTATSTKSCSKVAATRQFSANFCESNEFFEQNHLYYATNKTNEIEHSNSYRKIDMEQKSTTKPKPHMQHNRTSPSQLPQRLKKPRKFIPGELRESDYESELESIRIKPLWNPKEIESNEPYYRPVKVPVVVAASYKQRSSSNLSTAPLRIPSQPTKTTSAVAATTAAQSNRHLTMQKIGTNTTSHNTTNMSNLYREQKQLSQKGCTEIDPKTGLIYFKYDFGYEFGLMLPNADGKYEKIPYKSHERKAIENSMTAANVTASTTEFSIPVACENSQTKQQRVRTNENRDEVRTTAATGPKNVKWDRSILTNSESELSELSEVENFRYRTSNSAGARKNSAHKKRYSLSQLSDTKNFDYQSNFSPVSSQSPVQSLPSHSPRDNLWSTTTTISKRTRPKDYNNTPPSSTPTTPLHFMQTKNPPYFITPLRDIAVLCGRTARFECIVQSDQTPFISWSTNGHVLNHCKKYDIYYRNGVCRLTITNVTFNDSGNFLCTATNQLGSVNTTGSLQVNNDKRLTFVY